MLEKDLKRSLLSEKRRCSSPFVSASCPKTIDLYTGTLQTISITSINNMKVSSSSAAVCVVFAASFALALPHYGQHESSLSLNGISAPQAYQASQPQQTVNQSSPQQAVEEDCEDGQEVQQASSLQDDCEDGEEVQQQPEKDDCEEDVTVVPSAVQAPVVAPSSVQQQGGEDDCEEDNPVVASSTQAPAVAPSAPSLAAPSYNAAPIVAAASSTPCTESTPSTTTEPQLVSTPSSSPIASYSVNDQIAPVIYSTTTTSTQEASTISTALPQLIETPVSAVVPVSSYLPSSPPTSTPCTAEPVTTAAPAITTPVGYVATPPVDIASSTLAPVAITDVTVTPSPPPLTISNSAMTLTYTGIGHGRSVLLAAVAGLFFL